MTIAASATTETCLSLDHVWDDSFIPGTRCLQYPHYNALACTWQCLVLYRVHARREAKLIELLVLVVSVINYALLFFLALNLGPKQVNTYYQYVLLNNSLMYLRVFADIHQYTRILPLQSC